MNDKKEDCKYWDKCYQKNEHHLNTYNHPPKTQATEVSREKSPAPQKDEERDSTTEKQKTPEKKDAARKRRSSEAHAEADPQDAADDVNEGNVPPKRNSKRLWDHSEETTNESGEQSFSFIHENFLVKMPKDFYLFWKFVTNFSKKQIPFKNFNVDLVGPFDFLAGKFANVQNKSPGDFLRHWRFYYDPPEFQTLFVKRGSSIHYGYWRDDPKDEENLIIVRNDAFKGCTFDLVATNMFDAFAYYLEKDYPVTPFNHKGLAEMRKSISEFVQENKFERRSLVDAKAERAQKICAKTFHKVGIVVPLNRKTGVGYRSLIESDANLKKILNALDESKDDDESSPEDIRQSVMEKLQPIITASVIGLDECDFGTNLELGIDLFCSGHKELHEIVQNLLNPAYKLLDRPQYMAILKAHLADRRKGHNLSILD